MARMDFLRPFYKSRLSKLVCQLGKPAPIGDLCHELCCEFYVSLPGTWMACHKAIRGIVVGILRMPLE